MMRAAVRIRDAAYLNESTDDLTVIVVKIGDHCAMLSRKGRAGNGAVVGGAGASGWDTLLEKDNSKRAVSHVAKKVRRRGGGVEGVMGEGRVVKSYQARNFEETTVKVGQVVQVFLSWRDGLVKVWFRQYSFSRNLPLDYTIHKALVFEFVKFGSNLSLCCCCCCCCCYYYL
tara:strand:- start:423 stop:938 length:516 start_codon:yes stop_codon:yes gene_type:complete